MTDYKGNKAEDSSVFFELTTNDSTGARTDMSGTPTQADIRVYKDGVLMTLDASSVIVTKVATTVGVYHVKVDTAIDADFTPGSHYQVLFYPDETVASVLVASWLGSFDIENVYTYDPNAKVIADSIPADGSFPTVEQALYMIVQRLNESEVTNATTITVKKPDGSTALYTLTVDDSAAPSTSTRGT